MKKYSKRRRKYKTDNWILLELENANESPESKHFCYDIKYNILMATYTKAN